MDLKQYTAQQLLELSNQLQRIKGAFASVLDCANQLAEQAFPFPGIKLYGHTDGESVRIEFGNTEVSLFLTYSRLDDGRLVGRVTAVLTKHPLERNPVVLDWFYVTRQGVASFNVRAGEDAPELGANSLWLVLTLVERAVTHAPTEP